MRRWAVSLITGATTRTTDEVSPRTSHTSRPVVIANDDLGHIRAFVCSNTHCKFNLFAAMVEYLYIVRFLLLTPSFKLLLTE